MNLEGCYFATLKHDMYVTLPDEENIRLCIVTKGHLCLFNQALYPIEQVNWLYMLYSFNIKIKLDIIVK